MENRLTQSETIKRIIASITLAVVNGIISPEQGAILIIKYQSIGAQNEQD